MLYWLVVSDKEREKNETSNCNTQHSIALLVLLAKLLAGCIHFATWLLGSSIVTMCSILHHYNNNNNNYYCLFAVNGIISCIWHMGHGNRHILYMASVNCILCYRYHQSCSSWFSAMHATSLKNTILASYKYKIHKTLTSAVLSLSKRRHGR